MNRKHHPVMVAVLVLLWSNVANCQVTPADPPAHCLALGAVADTQACAKEARNAAAEIRRGRVEEPLTDEQYQRNALRRCDVHNGSDREDCLARMRGQGSAVGTVQGGGILRSLTTIIPPAQTGNP